MKELQKQLSEIINKENLDWNLIDISNGIKVNISRGNMLLTKDEKENIYKLVCMFQDDKLKDVSDKELIDLGLFLCSVEYKNIPDINRLVEDLNKMAILCNISKIDF